MIDKAKQLSLEDAACQVATWFRSQPKFMDLTAFDCVIAKILSDFNSALFWASVQCTVDQAQSKLLHIGRDLLKLLQICARLVLADVVPLATRLFLVDQVEGCLAAMRPLHNLFDAKDKSQHVDVCSSFITALCNACKVHATSKGLDGMDGYQAVMAQLDLVDSLRIGQAKWMFQSESEEEDNPMQFKHTWQFSPLFDIREATAFDEGLAAIRAFWRTKQEPHKAKTYDEFWAKVMLHYDEDGAVVFLPKVVVKDALSDQHGGKEQACTLLLPIINKAVIAEGDGCFTFATQDNLFGQRKTAMVILRRISVFQQKGAAMLWQWASEPNQVDPFIIPQLKTAFGQFNEAFDGITAVEGLLEECVTSLRDQAVEAEAAINNKLVEALSCFTTVKQKATNVSNLLQIRVKNKATARVNTLVHKLQGMIPKDWQSFGILEPDIAMIKKNMAKNPDHHLIEPTMDAMQKEFITMQARSLEDVSDIMAPGQECIQQAKEYVASASVISMVHLRKPKLAPDVLKREAADLKEALMERGCWNDESGASVLHEKLKRMFLDILETE